MLNKLPMVAIPLGVLIVTGAVLYVANAAPTVPPLSPVEAANPEKPFVVKLHAQWCPVCMVTKGVWSEIQDTYATRVKLVVFDFTNQANADAAAVEAARLGLQSFFDEFNGATGLVVVLDGRTKDVLSVISGSRDFAQYREAIDAALGSSR